MRSNVTDQKYWESIYDETRAEYNEPVKNGWKGVIANVVASSINKFGEYKSIVELGAGGSDWLIYLAKTNNSIRVMGVDYTEAGCEMLVKKAEKAGVSINVVYADIFELKESKLNKFDLVFSNGLVEHFTDLNQVLCIKKMFVSDNGYMYTLIPNMNGLTGLITKILDVDIYNKHVPYTLEQMEIAHINSGMEIVESGYLCSFNYGIFSACESIGLFRKFLNLVVIIFGRLQMCFEYYFLKLPVISIFSPYIYVVSKVNQYE